MQEDASMLSTLNINRGEMEAINMTVRQLTLDRGATLSATNDTVQTHRAALAASGDVDVVFHEAGDDDAVAAVDAVVERLAPLTDRTRERASQLRRDLKTSREELAEASRHLSGNRALLQQEETLAASFGAVDPGGLLVQAQATLAAVVASLDNIRAQVFGEGSVAGVHEWETDFTITAASPAADVLAVVAAMAGEMKKVSTENSILAKMSQKVMRKAQNNKRCPCCEAALDDAKVEKVPDLLETFFKTTAAVKASQQAEVLLGQLEDARNQVEGAIKVLSPEQVPTRAAVGPVARPRAHVCGRGGLRS
jgi:hypothetical protein